MVIDSRQKRFTMNMQLRQRFARAKPFRLKKCQILSGFFDFQKKQKVLKNSQNLKTWFQKIQIDNLAYMSRHVSEHTHAANHKSVRFKARASRKQNVFPLSE